MKKYYLINKTKIKAQSTAYYKVNNKKIKIYLKTYSKNYYKINKKKIQAYQQKNKEKKAIYNKIYEKKNAIKINLRKKKSRLKNPKIRLRNSIAMAIWRSLKGNKNGQHWEKLVGYTINDLKEHLEKQFTEGMTWKNYGKWHIDHKIPVNAWNFTKSTHEDFIKCFALSNLQPMWAKDNLEKGTRLTIHFQPSLLL